MFPAVVITCELIYTVFITVNVLNVQTGICFKMLIIWKDSNFHNEQQKILHMQQGYKFSSSCVSLLFCWIFCGIVLLSLLSLVSIKRYHQTQSHWKLFTNTLTHSMNIWGSESNNMLGICDQLTSSPIRGWLLFLLNQVCLRLCSVVFSEMLQCFDPQLYHTNAFFLM